VLPAEFDFATRNSSASSGHIEGQPAADEPGERLLPTGPVAARQVLACLRNWSRFAAMGNDEDLALPCPPGPSSTDIARERRCGARRSSEVGSTLSLDWWRPQPRGDILAE
jgi:hypothetical protein